MKNLIDHCIMQGWLSDDSIFAPEADAPPGETAFAEAMSLPAYLPNDTMPQLATFSMI